MHQHRKPPAGRASTGLQRTDTPRVYRRGNRYGATGRGGGRPNKATFATLEGAREARNAQEGGQSVGDGPRRFDAYAAEWIESYRGRTRRGLSLSTRGDYRRSLELYAVPYFAGQRMSAIAPRDVRGYVDHLELLGQAASSVRKNFAPVRALLATAVEEGVTHANPASVIRVVGASSDWEEDEPRALTRGELAAFFAAVPTEWEPLFQLLVQTGLRISE